MTILDWHNKYKNKNITYSEAELLLYYLNRDKRFELFIALYDATLKKNPIMAYKLFREAYCASDNIFKQIINSDIPFNLKKFLNFLQTNKVDFYSLMREKEYYDKLPDYFNIYRGMNELETTSNDFGISWSRSKEVAENYIYFNKNQVQKGGLTKKQISENDVLTIFSVHGNKEIIYIN